MWLFDLNHGDDGDRVYVDDHRDGDHVNDDGDVNVHHHVITMHRQSL